MALLRIENLNFRYPGAHRDALQDINLEVAAGEFLAICGPSGCGKSTLLRLIKQELAPAGQRRGTLLYDGQPPEAIAPRTSAGDIGLVQQDPTAQIVTDKVWHELAFGLENMGLPREEIRRRVAETAAFFGIDSWFHRDTATLSGGQKQLLNLAAVTAMRPRLLLLDEPTAQLDPLAATTFLATLGRLHRELGITVLLAEHRLEEVFPLAGRVLVLEDGRMLPPATPQTIGHRLAAANSPLLAALPAAMQVYHGLSVTDSPAPITVGEGKVFLEAHFAPEEAAFVPAPPAGDPAIALKRVCFRYTRDGEDILRDTDLTVNEGELFCLLGANGSGKTTLLHLLAGLEKPCCGQIRFFGQPKSGDVALLPQEPRLLFLENTVAADLAAALPAGTPTEQINQTARELGILPLLQRHPDDLSGGEQQLCALAKLLLKKPRVLLLDEPTKGLDAAAKRHLVALFTELCRQGITLLAVTHDMDFAAEAAHRCALFFDGQVLGADTPQRFFAGNAFYTTAASRMARGLWPEAVTCHQVLARCRKELC